jgi:predicted lipoprotein with Yx(FWY)xxD motif
VSPPSSPTRRRSRHLLAIAGVAVLALPACGGDDDDETAPSEAPAASDAPVPTDAAAPTAPGSGGTGTTQATATPAAGEGATVAVADSSLGPILVDGSGMTLYMFAPDAQGPSTCTDGCLEAWPMVHGPATAGSGVDASLLATAPRPEDGTEQATCDGWPLYTFVQDAAPGDVTGQGSGDKWYVLDATCTPVGM